MSKVLGRSSSFAAVFLVFASAIGCGVEADESGTETETASGALVAGQSFVVSFTGGGIPANAAAWWRRRAARSSRATTRSARCSPGRRAGPSRPRCARPRASTPSATPPPSTARSRRCIRKTVDAPPHKHPPLGGRRSAVVSPVGHGADPRPAGARDHGRQAVGAGRPVRLGRRHHPPGSRGPGEGVGERVLRGRHRQHRRRRAGRTIRSATARSRPAMVGAAKNNVGIVGVAPNVHAGDGQGRRRRLQRSERRPGVRRRVRLRHRLGDRPQLGSDQRQPHDRSVHGAGRRHLLQRPAGPGRDRQDRPPRDPGGGAQQDHDGGGDRELVLGPGEPGRDHRRHQLPADAGAAAARHRRQRDRRHEEAGVLFELRVRRGRPRRRRAATS